MFVGAVAVLDVLLQFGNGRVEVDQQIGLQELLVDDVEQALIQAEFILGEGDFGKQQTLGKKIIGDREVLEQIGLLDQFFELFETFGHEEELDRKGILIGFLIKLWKEGIVGEFLQHQPGVEFLAQQRSQGGFPGADIALDGDEVVFHEKSWGDNLRQMFCFRPRPGLRNAGYGQGVGALGEKFIHTAIEQRVNGAAGDLGQGREGESSICQFGVGNGQSLVLKDRIVE